MVHIALPPFAATSGPRDAKIAIVGEAFGEQEDMTKIPFIGNAGQELTRLLNDADINRATCFLTNVFAARPQDNKLDHWCASKKEVGKDYILPHLRQGKYIRPEYLVELARLKEELETVRPNLIVAMGGTATWAILQMPGIGKIRGAIAEAVLVKGVKVLPTFHPSYLFKVFADRPIVVADLMKAKREAEFPEIRRPQRFVLFNPALSDIATWIKEQSPYAKHMAVDIETYAGQIKMIGFAPSRRHTLVIPFVDFGRVGRNYWATIEEELLAWNYVQILLDLPCEKIFQNGLFDLQYLCRAGLTVRNCAQDTMLMHHAIYSETRKSLGFLGSLYTDEPAWKLMREKEDELKRDE